MHLGETGEFDLIRKIQNLVQSGDNNITKGIGDDTAVFDFPPNHSGLITTDSLVEGIHFDLSYTPFDSLGWKSLAVNISDIAAMGGKPLNAVIGLTLNDHWSEDNVLHFYEGLQKCSEVYQCPIAGGDTTWSSGNSVITVTVLGTVPGKKQILRKGSSVDDLIYVSRPLGGSRLGLNLLYSGEKTDSYKNAILQFLWPEAELNTVQTFINDVQITSMIDISDGLSSELYHLCEAGKTGCLIDAEAIPVHEDVISWCEMEDKDPIDFAFNSGEEYALLFTIPSGNKNILEAICYKNGIPITEIGRITSFDDGMHINRNGNLNAFTAKGWDHFCQPHP